MLALMLTRIEAFSFESIVFLPFIGYALLITLPVILWRFRFALPFKRCGRCRHCDYDMRGTADFGCPECGWGRTIEQA